MYQHYTRAITDGDRRPLQFYEVLFKILSKQSSFLHFLIRSQCKAKFSAYPNVTFIKVY